MLTTLSILSLDQGPKWQPLRDEDRARDEASPTPRPSRLAEVALRLFGRLRARRIA